MKISPHAIIVSNVIYAVRLPKTVRMSFFVETFFSTSSSFPKSLTLGFPTFVAQLEKSTENKMDDTMRALRIFFLVIIELDSSST